MTRCCPNNRYTRQATRPFSIALQRDDKERDTEEESTTEVRRQYEWKNEISLPLHKVFVHHPANGRKRTPCMYLTQVCTYSIGNDDYCRNEEQRRQRMQYQKQEFTRKTRTPNTTRAKTVRRSRAQTTTCCYLFLCCDFYFLLSHSLVPRHSLTLSCVLIKKKGTSRPPSASRYERPDYSEVYDRGLKKFRTRLCCSTATRLTNYTEKTVTGHRTILYNLKLCI